MEKKRLEFWIGSIGSLVPFAVSLIEIIYICIKGAPTETSVALFVLMGLMMGTFLTKSRQDYNKETLVGMADPTAVVPVLCWLIAGFFGAILESSELANGLVWAASQVHSTGGAFYMTSFIACAIYASAAGTSMGTIIPCMAIIYPAGVIIGANPVVLTDTIVSGGCFGDNLAPTSDTATTPAKINNAAIDDVVRSHLKYALVTATTACVLFLIFGGGEMQSQAENTRIMAGFATPRISSMILPAALTIFLAMKGHRLMESITWRSLFAIVGILVLGLLKFNDSLFITDGALQGILVNGVSSILGLCILAVLLAPVVHLFDYSGPLVRLREKLVERSIATWRKVEVSTPLIMGLFDTMISFGAVTMLVASPTLIKEIEKEFDISGVCPANPMGCSARTTFYLPPYMVPPVTVMTVSGEITAQYPEFVPQVAANQTMFTTFHPIVMMAAVLFAALTGWGSKDGERMKS